MLDEIRYERRAFSRDVRRNLEAKGHTLAETEDPLGNVNAIGLAPMIANTSPSCASSSIDAVGVAVTALTRVLSIRAQPRAASSSSPSNG